MEYFEAANVMKFPYFPLFRAKKNCETPEPQLNFDKSQHHLLSKRVLLIPVRSPNDHLQIVVFRCSPLHIRNYFELAPL